MKKFKIIKPLLSLALTVNFVSTAFAETITETNVNSLNNESTSSTYKIDSFDKYLTNINFSSSVINKDLEQPYKNVQGYSSQNSWLLENNIISNDDVFESDGYSPKTESTGYSLVDEEYGDYVKKSDAVMSICKAFFGVQESRPVVIKSKALKPYVVQGDDVLDFSEGNYGIFVTPNVYELYFTTMLDKGFISINDFKNVKFIKDYSDLKTQNKPSWFYTTKPYFTLTGAQDNPLGQTLKVSNTGFTCYSSFSEPNFFYSEIINKIDVYKLIEKILRTTERDMSETESNIISYKYGVDYLSYLDSDSKSCLMYLLAMGVVDFEDTTELEHLFEPMTVQDYLDVLYRVANKNARKDFSKVQLTDDDNYNLKNGFMQATITLRGESPSVMSIEKSNQVSEIKTDNWLVSSREITIHDGIETYTVKVAFNSNNGYKYMNENLGDLEKDADKGIKSIESKDDSYIVEFSIDAPNEAAALRMISERITSTEENNSSVAKISSLASVTSNGTDYEYYVPKSALQALKGSSDTEIVAVADKYLINQKTGTSALFLDDDKLAMVGNEVIETEKSDIRGITGEVYYNVKILARLMSNSYISKLKASEICSEPISSSKALSGRKYVDIVNYKTDAVMDKTMFANAETQGVYSDKGTKTKKSYMSILHAQNVNSCVYREIDDDTLMIVKWQYALPEYDKNTHQHQLSNGSLGQLAKQYNTNNPSVSEMNSFLSDEPKDSELGTWWRSNVGLSNALCNYIYETQGKKYFSNGYLAPSVTFLHKGDAISEDKMKEYLSKLDFDASYSSEFLQGGVNPANALFGQGTGMYGSLAQSRVLESYGSEDLDEDAIDYEGRFLKDRTGCLYESILTDADNYDCHNQMLQAKGDKIKIVPRKSVDTSFIKANREYKLNGQTLICGGEEFFPGTSSRVYKMYLKTPLNGTVKCGNDGYYRYYVDGEDDKELNTWYNGVISQFSDESMYRGMQHDYIVSTGPMEGLAEQGTPAKYLTCNNKSIYEALKLSQREQYVVEDDGSGNLKEDKIENGDSLDDVYVTPVFYLNVNKWACDGENLVESTLTPMTVRENLINVGLSRSVQDSIVAKCYDCASCDDLPDDSKVIIGDMTFTSKNGKLISNPVKDSTAIGQLTSQTDNTTVVSAMCKLFDGMTLFNTGNSSSGALSEHVVNNGGNRSIGLYSLKTVDKGFTTLMSDGGNLMIRTSDGSKAYNAGDTFDSFVFYVKFDKGVKFKPIDTNSNTYTILYVTDEGVNGTLTDIPYFTDELSYKWDLDIFGETGLNKFKAANDVLGLMESIKQAYDAAFRKDLKGLITIFFLNILAYLIVMVFVVGILSKQPSLMNLLKKLSDPGGDLKGVDLIKMLTFGMFTVDSDPSLVKCLGTDGVLIIILVVFVKLAY